MANDNQFKLSTLFVAPRGVEEYRASIAKYILPDDQVLEIGCEWGTTSTIIYETCKNLVATDIGRDCIERARTKYPDIRFEVLDVYDIRAAMAYKIDFTKMYIDVSGLSGYRSLLDVIALLNMYASVFKLEAIVIKSGALKNFAKNCVAWNSTARE